MHTKRKKSTKVAEVKHHIRNKGSTVLTHNSELGLALDLTKLVEGLDGEHARVFQEYFRNVQGAFGCCGLNLKTSTAYGKLSTLRIA